jgi:hypothetical protein
LHRRDKPVAPARNGFDKSRILHRFAKHLPKLCHGSIQAVLELNEMP